MLSPSGTRSISGGKKAVVRRSLSVASRPANQGECQMRFRAHDPVVGMRPLLFEVATCDLKKQAPGLRLRPRLQAA
jgi:hypothetical protein